MSCGVVTITAPATGYSLCEGKLDVPSAGRHVDDEVVERAPLSLGQQLRQRLG